MASKQALPLNGCTQRLCTLTASCSVDGPVIISIIAIIIIPLVIIKVLALIGSSTDRGSSTYDDKRDTSRQHGWSDKPQGHCAALPAQAVEPIEQ